MQLLTLEFEGIGPFTGRHTIDLQALGEGGLFLLEGPTGSGKTTIIDAIVFALYGDVAGVDSSKGRLVSTQLRPGCEPYVDAILETSRGLLRVRRVPQYERRKSRGNGTTIGKASIKLWKLAHPGDEGTLLSTSLQDATEELQRAIGLTKEQFTQTVVLPQGHFATFLRAKPEDRRGVLQDIFGTEFYERVARQLAGLASGYRSRDAAAQLALGQAAASFGRVAWSADDPAAEEFAAAVASGDSATVLALAEAQVAAVTATAARAAVVAGEAEAAWSAADGVLRAAVERNGLIAERVRLVERSARLAAAASEVAEAAQRVEAAERAEHVRRPLDAVTKAKAACEGANAEAARGRAQVADSPDADLLGESVGPEELEAASLSARERRSALTTVVETEEALPGRAASLKLDLERLAERRSAIVLEQKRVAADRAQASELMPELDAVRAIAATLGQCVALGVEAQGRLDEVRRLERVAAEYVEARGVEGEAREASEAAQTAYDQARTAWLAGLAGTLATELEDGSACPVCGSLDHPAPARLPKGAVSRARVEQLDADSREAGQHLAAAVARSDALATAMADQQDVVGDLTLREAEEAVSAATLRIRAAERAVEASDQLRVRIEELLVGADDRERRLRDDEQQLASDKGGLAVRAERLDQDRLRVADELDGYGSVAERALVLARRAERAQRLAVLLRKAEQAEVELRHRSDELAVVLAERGFAADDEARAALLAESERRRLAALVSEHQAQEARVAERLADPQLMALASAEAADEGPLAEASALAHDAAQTALRESGAAARGVRLATEASDELRSCVDEVNSVRAEAEPYLRMADLANGTGQNLDNVTLPTFVLLRRFEEVVDLANVRLGAMTGGRYSLRRTDAREGRSHKLGLGLEVVDHASGDAARDPKTLSGGETFQAALAMALGLADAVTSEAGGIELNTLFVDEGFGSLDPDALDMVMDQLSALREGGRCVGVVSHVADMKQRIAERITVIPRRDGTSTLACSTDPQPALAG